MKIHIHGVTAGKQTTIDAITLHINKLPCTFHVFNNDINLEVDGLIGCDNLQIHNGKIDMKEKFIKLGNIKLPFYKNESIIIGKRSKQIIHVNVGNDISEGIYLK